MHHTVKQAKSLQHLYAAKKPLEQLAAELARSMKAEKVPSEIETGKLYQLSGKTLHGANCLSLIIIPNARAICIDLSTGVVGSVDQYGVRSTTMIGGRR